MFRTVTQTDELEMLYTSINHHQINKYFYECNKPSNLFYNFNQNLENKTIDLCTFAV